MHRTTKELGLGGAECNLPLIPIHDGLLDTINR